MLESEMLVASNTQFWGPEVVQIRTVPLPKIKRDQILVRNYATTVSTADSRLRSRNVPRGFKFIMGLLFGFSTPKYSSLGTDLAGEIVAIWEDVNNFTVGQRVVANLGMSLGGHAEYTALDSKAPVVCIPDTISYHDAVALVFWGNTALVFLRDKLCLSPGQHILIVGAGGAVGSSAVQIAKSMGAQVTAVCGTDKVSQVEKLGADRVIDYTKEDWREVDRRYDVVFDTTGDVSWNNAKHTLSQYGRMGLIVADLPTNISSIYISLWNDQKVIAGPVTEKREDLEYLLSLCEQWKLKPVIGAVFPLHDIVLAHKMVDGGHKLGSVVISL